MSENEKEKEKDYFEFTHYMEAGHDLAGNILDELDAIIAKDAEQNPDAEGNEIMHIEKNLSAADLLEQFFMPAFDKAVEDLQGNENMLSAMSSKEFLEALHVQITNQYQKISNKTTKIDRNKVENISFPVDKVSSNWNAIIPNQSENIFRGNYDTLTKQNKKGPKEDKQITASLLADFSELPAEFSKELTPLEKRFYLAIGANFYAGNRVVTFPMIYRTMGNKSKPSNANLQSILQMARKLQRIFIKLDNKKENEIAKGNYEYVSIESSLLPVTIATKWKAGTPGNPDKVTDLCITIESEPPLLQFARKRHQMSMLPSVLLEAPVNKTDMTVRMEDYLLITILKKKNALKNKKIKSPSFRILYKTILEKCGVETAGKYGTQNAKRALEILERYLKYYKENEFIKSYKVNEDGVTITIKDERK